MLGMLFTCWQVVRGEERKKLDLIVSNLHDITPRTFIDFGGSCLHPLSYQQAMNFVLPVGVVLVAQSGKVIAV